jgi:hypothetical protein
MIRHGELKKIGEEKVAFLHVYLTLYRQNFF